MQHCGMVAIVGKPNAGKSTLMNAFVGQKISIVTHKPQTTRRQIQGIAIMDNTQVVFVDTPGIFNFKGAFEEALVDSAYKALQGVDLVIVLIDPADFHSDFLNVLQKKLKNQRYFIVINKTDVKSHNKQMIDTIKATCNHIPIYEISALQGTGLEDLKSAILTYMPPHPWLYEEDQLTNISQKIWAAEIIREQALLCLHQEVPYALYVDCESYEESEDNSLRIHASIVLSADRYKPIVLGHKGSMIKKIGSNARQQLELQMGLRVHLFLNVKVTPKWQEKIHVLRREGVIS